MSAPRGLRRPAVAGGALGLAGFAALLCEGRPSALLERGPFSSDFFDAQAAAILEGRLDVDPAVASLEGFEVDGRTYLYFGIVPALARLPVVALTDGFDGRLSRLSMLAAMAVALVGAVMLAERARRAVRGGHPIGRADRVVAFGFPLLVAWSSPLLWLGARPLVYHEAELWGAAMALIAFDRVLEWWERPSARGLAVASLAAAVALSTRASVGSGPLLALGLAAMVRARPLRAGRLAGLGTAVLAPIAPYVAVNIARFGTPVSVPFERQVLSRYDPARQAALAANDGTLFSLGYLPTTLLAYLRPDGVRLSELAPWLTYPPPPPILGGAVFDTVDRTASVWTVAPALGLLALIGAAWALWRRELGWALAMAGAGGSLLPVLTIGFIANRYLADFTPLLVVPGALGAWAAASLAHRRPRAGLAAVVALAGAGAVVGAALAVQSQRLYLLPEQGTRRDFVALQQDLHLRLGGDGVVGVSAGPLPRPAAAAGQVRIVEDCAGLYWSDGSSWYPLERGGSRGQLVRADQGEATSPLATGGRQPWLLEVVPAPGGAIRFVHTRPGGERAESAPLERAALRDGFVLVADPDLGLLQVRAQDRLVLHVGFLDVEGLSLSPGWRAEPLPTPLCERLEARLGTQAGGQVASSSYRSW